MTVTGPIWLVRHAQTEWTGRRWCGRSNPGLTEAGRVAAERLATEIAADIEASIAAAIDAGLTPRLTGGTVVLTSPLRRALHTAEAVARALDAPIEVEPELVEVDYGAADGLTWDQLVAAHPSLAEAILVGRDPDWPGGETAARVADRARSVGDRILEHAATTTVVVVSHGGLLPAIARHLGRDVSPGRFEAASALRVDPVAVR
jgi:broad specificity phosphatase PhoE